MQVTTPLSAEVSSVIESWPGNVQSSALELRELIYSTARAAGDIEVTETLKWGEPAYVTKKGSPLRLGWSNKTPRHYRLHFICTTKLADTYRELYADTLIIEGKRAIVFHSEEPIPVAEVSHCISLALRYHQVKNLPNLGC